jgi:hypothetical protein
MIPQKHHHWHVLKCVSLGRLRGCCVCGDGNPSARKYVSLSKIRRMLVLALL